MIPATKVREAQGEMTVSTALTVLTVLMVLMAWTASKASRAKSDLKAFRALKGLKGLKVAKAMLVQPAQLELPVLLARKVLPAQPAGRANKA